MIEESNFFFVGPLFWGLDKDRKEKFFEEVGECPRVLVPIYEESTWFWMDLRRISEDPLGRGFSPSIFHPLMTNGYVSSDRFFSLEERILTKIGDEMNSIFGEKSQAIKVGKPPDVLGLQTYQDLYRYSISIMPMCFRQVTRGQSIVSFDNFDPARITQILIEDIHRRSFTETGAGFTYLRRAVSQACSSKQNDRAYFEKIDCFQSDTGSTVETKTDLDSMLYCQSRSIESWRKSIGKVDTESGSLVKLTAGEQDVRRSQLIMKHFPKDALRKMKRSSRQVRYEGSDYNLCNATRRQNSQKRTQKHLGKLINKAAEILLSSWSEDSQRILARKMLTMSDTNQHTRTISDVEGQQIRHRIKRNRGSIKKHRLKRRRSRKVDSLRRENPKINSMEIYSDPESECCGQEDIGFQLSDTDCQDNVYVPHARRIHLICFDRDDGWIPFVLKGSKGKIFFPRADSDTLVSIYDPFWEQLRDIEIVNHLGLTETVAMNDWSSKKKTVCKIWMKVLRDQLIYIVSVK